MMGTRKETEIGKPQAEATGLHRAQSERWPRWPFCPNNCTREDGSRMPMLPGVVGGTWRCTKCETRVDLALVIQQRDALAEALRYVIALWHSEHSATPDADDNGFNACKRDTCKQARAALALVDGKEGE